MSLYHEIVNPSGFVNTSGITIGELIGKKIVMVFFWTFGCGNCQRTVPHVNSWYTKYKDQGFEVIGIHTPEFPHEGDINNVTQAANKLGVAFPTVLDNEYGTWRAYDNNYWPRRYLLNLQGEIVYDKIGEGDYEGNETKIRELLMTVGK